MAIKNARLFDTETRRSAQLDVLNLMGRELTRIFDLENNAITIRALAGSIEGKIPIGTRRPLDRGITG
jgi:hypothetical protein